MHKRDAYWTAHRAFIDVFSDEFTAIGGYHVVRTQGTPDWLLTYTMAGRGLFDHGNGPQIASAREAILIEPGTPHDYRLADDADFWRFCWAHFHAREHWLKWLNWPAEVAGIHRLTVRDPAQHRRLLHLFRQVVGLTQSARRGSLPLAMNRLEEILLIFEEINLKPLDAADERVGQAMTFIQQNLANPLSLKVIADAVGLSDSRLWHLFKRHVGQSPQDYLEFQRFSRAKLLLERTDRSVNQVANEVGFLDSFYFARRFRRSTGYSPLTFRRQARSAADRPSGARGEQTA